MLFNMIHFLYWIKNLYLKKYAYELCLATEKNKFYIMSCENVLSSIYIYIYSGIILSFQWNNISHNCADSKY